MRDVREEEAPLVTTETEVPRQSMDDNRELRLLVVLLALALGMLTTCAAVYLAWVHPALAQPLGVGAAVASTLAPVCGGIARFLRR
ncbi:hypothetical protein ACHBTE_15695 [Streptomyces sp. M41]|uniref:hypothetical protein n=1 Tax=Streptomyces sp. M41 TaxID=3059412 RepID=UPI00374D645A